MEWTPFAPKDERFTLECQASGWKMRDSRLKLKYSDLNTRHSTWNMSIPHRKTAIPRRKAKNRLIYVKIKPALAEKGKELRSLFESAEKKQI